MKKRIILFLMMTFLLNTYVLANSVKEIASLDFIKAGALYQTEDYAGAIKGYQKILDQGVSSAAVYYNLGNAYFKSENLGKAILYYEKALRIAPRDPDIEANLRFARSLIERYGEEEKQTWWAKLMPHLHLVSLDEITWIVLILFFIFGGVVLIGMIRHWRLSRQIMWSGTVLILLLFHSIVLVAKVTYLSHQGVVLSQAKAKFEPMNDATDHFELGEGMVVQIIKKQYGWVKIKRIDDRIGWVPEKVIDEI